MNSSKLLSTTLIAIALIGNTAAAQSVAITPVVNNNATTAATGTYTWAPIKEKDIDKKRRYWLDIDTKAEQNKALAYNESGSALIDVIINGVKDGKLIAYSAMDDRFNTPLTVDEFNNLLWTTYLAARLTDPKGKEIIYQSGTSQFRPESVTKFRIKEDSLHVKGADNGIVRIVGLAPIVELVNKKGEAVEQPFFWIYYPDALNYFSASKTINPALTWADILEGQQFSGKIIKESKAK